MQHMRKMGIESSFHSYAGTVITAQAGIYNTMP